MTKKSDLIGFMTCDTLPPDAGVKAADPGMAANACKGQNSCKGQGGCKSGDNGCKGKNSCKGKGGCKSVKKLQSASGIL